MGKRIKLIKGSVRLEVRGYEPERLLNILAERGIEFWDTSPKTECSIEFSVCSKDYPEISGYNGKNGLEILLLSSRGGKELSRALKRRYAFLALLIISTAFLAVSSLFVWRIEVSGNDTLSTQSLLRVLSESGVSCGAYWPGIDSEKVRNEVLLKLPDVAWLSVNVNSSCVKVTVHERSKKPDLADELCRDIVAEKSGIVTKLSVLEGEARCAAGDTVIKGEVLISGTMTSGTANERYVHSRGTVTARTWYEINAQMPLYESRKVYSGRVKKKFSLIIGKNRIFFFGDSRNVDPECDKMIKLKTLSVNNKLYLPIGIMTEKYSEYETELTQIDIKSAAEYLENVLHYELQKRTDGGEIVSASFTEIKDDKMLTVTLRSECIEEIGEDYDRENNRG